jgi:type III restriction enzyme
MLTLLTEKCGLTLEQLTAHRYKLSQASQRKVEACRKKAQGEVFDGLVLPKGPLVVSNEGVFTFPPDCYPCNTSYPASRHFRNHYYPLVGEMKNEGEEFECARFLDNLPEVQFWVRNLSGPGREKTSFWLQTSTDKFYPDFVCKLKDGHRLVVEYKNKTDWSNDDSKEKRKLGELWEARDPGDCIFYMPKGSTDVPTIREKIKASPCGS